MPGYELSKTDLEQLIDAGGVRQIHHAPRNEHAEQLRRRINEYSEYRLQKGDGWWRETSVGAMKVVREHNFRCGRGKVLDWLTREMPAGAWVLDWAGGTGWMASEILKRRPDLTVVSLDISDALQEWGRANYPEPALYICGDATNPAIFEPGVFDAVVGAECVEHFPNLGDALRSAHCWLRPEGTLVVTTPNPSFWAPQPPALMRKLMGKPAPGPGMEEGIHDEGIPSSTLFRELTGAGFRKPRLTYSQFAGEWPLRGICQTIGLPPARAAARVVETLEPLTPGTLGRKLGFTQIAWAVR